MIKVIKEIFKNEKFLHKQLTEGDIFYYDQDSGKTQYWLVVSSKLSSILNVQSDYLLNVKEHFPDVDVDKNISMLILNETKDTADRLKNDILNIEEDPYLFKKQVLYYAPEELEALLKKAKIESLYDFILDSIVSEECFREFKAAPFEKTWNSLIYRISKKVPIVDLRVQEEESLDSLTITIDNAVSNCGLDAFDEEFDKHFLTLDAKSVKEVKASDLLEKLNPKKKTDGNNS